MPMLCENPECPGREDLANGEELVEHWSGGYRLPYGLEPGEPVSGLECPACGVEGVPDENP